MEEDKYWGELRSRLAGEKTQKAFINLWQWLQSHPNQFQRREVQDYVQHHLSNWPKQSRLLWKDELLVAPGSLQNLIRSIQPGIACPSELHSFSTKQPASINTPLGSVEVISSVDGYLSYLFSIHGGYTISENQPCWVWEHDTWSIQIRAFIQPAQDEWVHGSVLLSYKLMAHAPIHEHTLFLQWHPEHEHAQLGQDCGEHLEAQTWSGEVEYQEDDWMRWDWDEKPVPQFCLGTNNHEVIIQRARDWWPGKANPGDIHGSFNGLRIELPKMQSNQRVRVWSAFAWGMHSLQDEHCWGVTSALLDHSARFDDLTTR